MAAQHENDATCHTKDCLELATQVCERCGQSYCSTHVRHLVIERREERSEYSQQLGALRRLPTYTESYTLCLRCSTKPVPRKPPQARL